MQPSLFRLIRFSTLYKKSYVPKTEQTEDCKKKKEIDTSFSLYTASNTRTFLKVSSPLPESREKFQLQVQKKRYVELEWITNFLCNSQVHWLICWASALVFFFECDKFVSLKFSKSKFIGVRIINKSLFYWLDTIRVLTAWKRSDPKHFLKAWNVIIGNLIC